MTIDFNTIRLHDIVNLNNGDDIDGWFLITGVSKKVGFFTATQLGYDIRPVMVPSDRMDIVRKHYSVAAVPGAIEALEQIAGGELIVEGKERDAPESLQKTLGVSAQRVKDICIVGPDNSALFAFIAVRLARDALRAVRGEESA